MAFPSVISTGYSEETANVSSHDVVLPATFYADSLLLLHIAMDGNRTLSGFPTGWVELDWTGYSTVVRGGWYYKIADGTETDFAYTSSGVDRSTNRCFAIQGWHGTTPPEEAHGVHATTTTPDPPSLSPSWGSADTLWFVSFAADNGTNAATAYPTNYSDNQFTDNTTSTAGVSMAVASREVATATEDPGSFTKTGGQEVVFHTVAVRPGTAGGPPAASSSRYFVVT